VSRLLRLGTRGSALALAQAGWVRTQLQQRDPTIVVDLVTIKTSGDRFIDRPLSAIGGKGLFVKEIEDALLAGAIDCAVHSMKDLPAQLPPELTIAAVPPREDPRDALLARLQVPCMQLPRGARLGTSSLRRAALLRHWRRDFVIEPLRGNVDTRLRRLERGELDGLVLAAAGLRRLGLEPPGLEFFDPQQFIPAIGQGALAVQSRRDTTAQMLAVLDDAPTRTAVLAERAFMAGVGGSCQTPLAAHGRLSGDALVLNALIASPDGNRMVRGTRTGAAADGEFLGHDLAAELLRRGGAEILATLNADASRASDAADERD
jgi:hydroxymethylbilane synthase